MAKHLLTYGIGLSPGSVKYLVLLGLSPDVVIPSDSHLAPAATLKISHARILSGYRNQAGAADFHHFMKVST